MWITGMGNHGAAWGISERRLSSCSSFDCCLMSSRKHHDILMPLVLLLKILIVNEMYTYITTANVYCVKH